MTRKEVAMKFLKIPEYLDLGFDNRCPFNSSCNVCPYYNSGCSSAFWDEDVGEPSLAEPLGPDSYFDYLRNISKEQELDDDKKRAV